MFAWRSVPHAVLAWSVAAILPLVASAAAHAAPLDPPEEPRPAATAKKGDPKAKIPAPAVPLEFTEAIESKTTKKGDLVSLRVVDDVTIDGKLRFRKDAEASGIIEEVKQPGRFGRKAQIRIRLNWAKDINGEPVPLTSYSTGNRYAAGAGGASLGGAIFLGPIGLLGGALVKGGHITIKKGTRIQAKLLTPKRTDK